MIDTVIIDAARTPVGRKMGKLAGAHPTDTLGHVMMKLLERQGLDSSQLAHSIIAAGHADVVLACGVENMSRLPIGSDAVGREPTMGKPVSKSYFAHHEFTSQFEGAERVAEKYGIGRADTDAFGLRSQELAAAAIAEGRFASQIIPIEAPQVARWSWSPRTRCRGIRASRRWPSSSRWRARTASTPRAPPRRSPTAPLQC